MSLVDPTVLTGKVMTWRWARLFSILPNTYALCFLVGGAAWSAVQYARKRAASNRVFGNWLIAGGALLPALGGGLARFGNADLLGISEFIGISLIYLGYRLISPAPTAAPSAA
jgi:hypothetical protein